MAGLRRQRHQVRSKAVALTVLSLGAVLTAAGEPARAQGARISAPTISVPAVRMPMPSMSRTLPSAPRISAPVERVSPGAVTTSTSATSSGASASSKTAVVRPALSGRSTRKSFGANGSNGAKKGDKKYDVLLTSPNETLIVGEVKGSPSPVISSTQNRVNAKAGGASNTAVFGDADSGTASGGSKASPDGGDRRRRRR